MYAKKKHGNTNRHFDNEKPHASNNIVVLADRVQVRLSNTGHDKGFGRRRKIAERPGKDKQIENLKKNKKYY